MELGEGRLQTLLREVVEAGQGETVSVADALEAVGQKSFGALLLLPSVVIVSPISGIPGTPTLAAVMIVLVCVQFLLGRDTVWLPARLLRMRIARHRLEWAVGRAGPVLTRFDRLVRPRFSFMINRWTIIAMVVICAALAATMPPMELLPLTSTLTAAIIALFALAILAGDGLLALGAMGASLLAGGGFLFLLLPEIADLIH
ncbi:exopolysaccharide biosynthesis protein [Acuticoccus kandeliae]|uniref:exopolysaccharide biosynthesis protein n=1 Tax=Acuticoccus kandeliae TaxID=2073160 RepID=UPI00130056FE|nr:exopolysaccharide biosynthesis protein [Acuticoccus kandeliae]